MFKNKGMLAFTFLGTSSGVPTRQRNVSGLAVQTVAGPDWLLVDAGEGTQHRLQRARLSLHSLAVVCITHAHGDHCYGLPGLLESAGLAGRTRPLTLVAPASVQAWLQATRTLTDAPLPFDIAFVDVAAQERVWQAPGLRLERHLLRHRVPSHAYSLEVERRRPGPAGEVQRVRAVFAGDNAEPALLRDACSGAQVLVHEATYTQAVLDKVGPASMHSSARMVGEFADSVALPNLVLTHFSARYHNAAAIAPLEAEARAEYGGNLWLANDLDVFDLDAAGVLSRRAEGHVRPGTSS